MESKLIDYSFTLETEQDLLDDVNTRVKNSRITKDFGNQKWQYGTEESYLKDLIHYWINDYDWRAQEKKINTFSHYKIEIDKIPIHFIYEKGSGENPKPLILSHGWPWTFWDYQKIFAHGGDWGAAVTLQLGHKYSKVVPAVHTHMTIPIDVFTNPQPGADDYGEDEKKWYEKNINFATEGNGYFQIQATKPQTLSYGLNDSPVGLLAWLIEKRRSWSDCEGNIENCFSKDDLINTTMIYWLSESFGTSARYYYEAVHNPWQPSHDRHPMVESATGFTIFEGDVIFRPKEWMKKEHNIQYWNVAKSGGHFAPMEKPEFLTKEIRKFFSSYRKLI